MDLNRKVVSIIYCEAKGITPSISLSEKSNLNFKNVKIEDMIDHPDFFTFTNHIISI